MYTENYLLKYSYGDVIHSEDIKDMMKNDEND